MSTSIFAAFDARGQMVNQYLSGVKLDPQKHSQPQMQSIQMQQRHQPQQLMNDHFQHDVMPSGNHGMNLEQNGGLEFYGGSGLGNNMGNSQAMGGMGNGNEGEIMGIQRSAQRNPSIISFGGNGLRHMSFTSEAASYGRAMSGLSALSIDWENMDDFDINVDHSSHINNGGSPDGAMMNTQNMGGGGGGRRSSLRRSFVATNEQDAHVSFKV